MLVWVGMGYQFAVGVGRWFGWVGLGFGWGVHMCRFGIGFGLVRI